MPGGGVVAIRVVGVEEVGIRLLPEVGERDVHALRLAVQHGRAAAARDVEIGVGGADDEVVEAVAVHVGQRCQRHAGVRILAEAVVAAADRRGRRHRIGRQAGVGENGRVDVGRVVPPEDDVDRAAAARTRRSRHGRADRDVGQAVVVDVVAGDGVAEHLAPVPGDPERGVREVDRGGRARERARVAEEDVDDAGVRAACIGRGQADGVVAVAVAVDVAELSDRGQRPFAVRDAERRQRSGRQRARADRALEHAEAEERSRQRQCNAWLPQTRAHVHRARARPVRARRVATRAAAGRAS